MRRFCSLFVGYVVKFSRIETKKDPVNTELTGFKIIVQLSISNSETAITLGFEGIL